MSATVQSSTSDTGDGTTEKDADWATTRFGLAGHAVYYALLTLLVGRLALGRSADASAEGALATVARQPFGQVLLGGLTIAFAAYTGHHVIGLLREDDTWERLLYVLRSVVWAGLTLLTGRTVVTGITGGGGDSRGLTRQVLSWPAGPWLVAGIGVLVLGVAVYQGWKAQHDELADELEELELGEHRAARWLGRVGYAGRSFAYAITGVFLVQAAVTHDPSKGGGLDAALRRVQEAPYGKPLLFAIAAALGCFALFRFVEARYRDTDGA